MRERWELSSSNVKCLRGELEESDDTKKLYVYWVSGVIRTKSDDTKKLNG